MNHQKRCQELLGRRLKRWRRARGWPLKRIAADLRVSVPTVSDWERGTRFPSIEHLMTLASLFRQPVCHMLCAGREHCANAQCRAQEELAPVPVVPFVQVDLMKPWRTMASQEVQRARRDLPATVREVAGQVAVTYEDHPSRRILEAGLPAGLPAIFCGLDFSLQEAGARHRREYIVLFLGNLWLLAQGERTRFRQEVRRAYLHELSRYLAIDEAELRAGTA